MIRGVIDDVLFPEGGQGRNIPMLAVNREFSAIVAPKAVAPGHHEFIFAVEGTVADEPPLFL